MQRSGLDEPGEYKVEPTQRAHGTARLAGWLRQQTLSTCNLGWP